MSVTRTNPGIFVIWPIVSSTTTASEDAYTNCLEHDVETELLKQLYIVVCFKC